MADDQHGQGVVQLVALSVGFVLQGLAEHAEDVDRGFAVRFLEGSVEGFVLYLGTERKDELGVYFLYILQESAALVI